MSAASTPARGARDSNAPRAYPVLPHFPAVIRDDLAEIAATLGGAVQALAGRRVLVTGASGMLPAYVVDTLAYLNDTGILAEPCRLVLVARSAERAAERLGHLLHRKDVELVVADVRALPALDAPADYVIHAAAPAAPKDYFRDPVGSLDANTVALRALLEHARAGARSFLYVSSSEVYGTPDPECIPTPETYVGRIDPLGRRAYYAEAKRAGETYCRAYHEQYGVPVKIARPFHVHGPGLRLDDGRVVAALVAMGLEGRPLALESDGRATRTYGYILDATVSLLAVLLSSLDGEAFNVGTDFPETSVLELATEIASLFGRTEPVRVAAAAAPREGAPARACPDLGKLRRAFGLAPRIPLREGLSRTIAWCRERREKHVA